MRTIYVAHPLNAPTEQGRNANRESAARWAAWLAYTFRVAVVCDWIVLSGVLTEEQGREFGLEIDKALISRCDGVFLCGTRVSSGMTVESEHAKAIGLSVFDGTDMPQLPAVIPYVMRDVIRGWIESLPEAA